MEVTPAQTAGAAVDVATVQAAPSTSNAPPSVQGVISNTNQSQQDANQNQNSNPGIAPAIAKLFGSGTPEPIQLNVSYRVEGSDVVTVFSDPKTGKEIAQFPPELLLGLAKFFDQQAGVTFDKNA